MKKTVVLSAILSIIGLAFAGCGGTPVIRIGVLAEITGSIPAVGTSCRNAATLAAG